MLIIQKHEEQTIPKVTLNNLLPGYEPNLNSRHVIIAISGWLSEDEDKVEAWEQLRNFLRCTKVSLFALDWPSNKPQNLARDTARIAAGVKKNSAISKQEVINLSSLVGIGPIDLMRSGFVLADSFGDVFRYSKKSAKITGKLLAYTLAIGNPFLTQSVSLIGFSLGN